MTVQRIIGESRDISCGCESVGLILTYACNLRCTYCYVSHKDGRTMPLQTAQEVLSSVLNGGEDPLSIYIAGAEPLARFDRLHEIVEWVKAGTWPRPWHFVAATNGTLLNDAMKAWFWDNREHISLGLSYDGDNASQDENRGGSSSRIDMDFFKRTWPGQRLKMTVSQDAVSRMSEGIIRLTEEGFRFTANAAYEPAGWSGEAILTYERELFHLADYYAEHPDAWRCNLLSRHPLHLLTRDGERQPEYCSAGNSYEVYDVDGQCYPCHMLSPLVLDGERVKQARGIDFASEGCFEDPRCMKCALRACCPTCAGINYLRRGGINLRDNTICRLFHAEVRAILHMHIRMLGKKERYTELDRRTLRAVRRVIRSFDQGEVGLIPQNDGDSRCAGRL